MKKYNRVTAVQPVNSGAEEGLHSGFNCPGLKRLNSLVMPGEYTHKSYREPHDDFPKDQGKNIHTSRPAAILMETPGHPEDPGQCRG